MKPSIGSLDAGQRHKLIVVVVSASAAASAAEQSQSLVVVFRVHCTNDADARIDQHTTNELQNCSQFLLASRPSTAMT